jgi:hypothetical protein
MSLAFLGGSAESRALSVSCSCWEESELPWGLVDDASDGGWLGALEPSGTETSGSETTPSRRRGGSAGATGTGSAGTPEVGSGKSLRLGGDGGGEGSGIAGAPGPSFLAADWLMVFLQADEDGLTLDCADCVPMMALQAQPLRALGASVTREA